MAQREYSKLFFLVTLHAVFYNVEIAVIELKNEYFKTSNKKPV